MTDAATALVAVVQRNCRRDGADDELHATQKQDALPRRCVMVTSRT